MALGPRPSAVGEAAVGDRSASGWRGDRGVEHHPTIDRVVLELGHKPNMLEGSDRVVDWPGSNERLLERGRQLRSGELPSPLSMGRALVSSPGEFL